MTGWKIYLNIESHCKNIISIQKLFSTIFIFIGLPQKILSDLISARCRTVFDFPSIQALSDLSMSCKYELLCFTPFKNETVTDIIDLNSFRLFLCEIEIIFIYCCNYCFIFTPSFQLQPQSLLCLILVVKYNMALMRDQ